MGTSSAAKMVNNFLDGNIFTAFSFAVQDTHLLMFFVLDPRLCLLGHIREAPKHEHLYQAIPSCPAIFAPRLLR